jgi:hypothetical protein
METVLVLAVVEEVGVERWLAGSLTKSIEEGAEDATAELVATVDTVEEVEVAVAGVAIA